MCTAIQTTAQLTKVYSGCLKVIAIEEPDGPSFQSAASVLTFRRQQPKEVVTRMGGASNDPLSSGKTPELVMSHYFLYIGGELSLHSAAVCVC